MMIIDTHTHLDDIRYEDDLKDVLLRAKQDFVSHFIIPAADLKTLPRAMQISEKYENVYFAAGTHPYELDSFDEESIIKALGKKKCLAVGECGLDYYRNPSENEKIKQKEIFKKQIALSLTHNKPLILHVRDANSDVYEILKDYSDIKGVFHCYNACENLLDFSNNFYYGIGGVLTFKNEKKLSNIIKKIPLEKILIETDSPYLTPHPFRGQRNEPRYCLLVVDKIAQILNISREEVSQITSENAKKLFKGLI